MMKYDVNYTLLSEDLWKVNLTVYNLTFSYDENMVKIGEEKEVVQTGETFVSASSKEEVEVYIETYLKDLRKNIKKLSVLVLKSEEPPVEDVLEEYVDSSVAPENFSEEPGSELLGEVVSGDPVEEFAEDVLTEDTLAEEPVVDEPVVEPEGYTSEELVDELVSEPVIDELLAEEPVVEEVVPEESVPAVTEESLDEPTEPTE